MTAPRSESAADIAARFTARRAGRSPTPRINPMQAEHDRLLRQFSRQRGFVDGWKDIATILDRSERWCRYSAAVGSDPLPVFKVGGINRLNIADLDAWLDRQRAATIARPQAVTSPAIEEHW